MKKEAINKIKNWAEDTINVSELEASGVPVNHDQVLKELKAVILNAKKAGLSVDEIKEYMLWNYDQYVEKYFEE